MRENTRTMIAVPCMDHVPTLFCQSLALLKKVGQVSVAFQIGSLIYTSRNNLATKAIQSEADFVLWLDSDMVFEPDLLERMFADMEEHDLDILTGLYFRRVPPYSPVLFDRLEMQRGVCEWSNFKSIPDELFEVGGCGFGCVLMKTDVFIDVQARHRAMFDPILKTGEDLAFCWRARDVGYKIMCDPSIVCGHIGNIVVNDKFYNEFSKNK